MTLPGNITLERVDPAASTPIPSTDGYAELEAGITAPEGTQMNLTYLWQIFNAQAGTWSTAPDDSQLRNASNTYRTRTVGQYRCLVTATVTGDGGTTTTTALATPPGCRNVLRSSHNATARYLYRTPPLLGRGTV